MNNLDKIIEKITEETKVRTSAIAEKAQAEADAIIAKAEEKARLEREAVMAATEKECDNIVFRAESAAAMRQREILLNAKVQKIEEIYTKAENSLYELNDAEYTRLLSRLIAGAVSDRLRAVADLTALYGETESAETPVFEAILNTADKEKFGLAAVDGALALLQESGADLGDVALSLSDTTAAIRGGVILRYGDIETNCSVKALIASAKTKVDADVVKTLFPA